MCTCDIFVGFFLIKEVVPPHLNLTRKQVCIHFHLIFHKGILAYFDLCVVEESEKVRARRQTLSLHNTS